MQPTITFPQDTRDIVINAFGEVYATTDQQVQPQLLGQLSLSNFVNEAGLEPMGNNLFRQERMPRTMRSQVWPAIRSSAPSIRTISRSRTSIPVKEITELISAQRSYEMNSKVIQAVDSMYGTVSDGMR